MANFILSSFADEISSNFDEQLIAVKKLEIPLIELRGVDGKSFAALSDDEVMTVKAKLEKASIGLSALGSPIGKITLDDDFDTHLQLLDRIMDIGDMLNCKRIRMFSFYCGSPKSEAEFKKQVIIRIRTMLDKVKTRGLTLYHENEKDIFGYSPERVLELAREFGGELRIVLDNGNFSFCGVNAAPAYGMLRNYIDYMHIKDADEDGIIVPPGKGVACIKEVLQNINIDNPGKDIIITMEPHLMMFTGLEGLSKLDDIKHKYIFETPFEAFRVATEAVRDMIADLKIK
ncbi:MAG: hypothetical protein A2Y17_08980 [Clostridiales bacterium GWF2_38_85]|nr:MAG: hypothetical protein A2Y17_08980 [Clostridiales bacterium GWF2_38_85]HBL83670.1 xylose isomerase [Clostridiales bacterium]